MAFANVVIDWDEIGVKTVQPIWFAAESGLALCFARRSALLDGEALGASFVIGRG